MAIRRGVRARHLVRRSHDDLPPRLWQSLPPTELAMTKGYPTLEVFLEKRSGAMLRFIPPRADAVHPFVRSLRLRPGLTRLSLVYPRVL